MFGFGKKKEKEETALRTVANAIADYRDKMGKSPTEMVLSVSFYHAIRAEFTSWNDLRIATPPLLGILISVDEHATQQVVMR